MFFIPACITLTDVLVGAVVMGVTKKVLNEVEKAKEAKIKKFYEGFKHDEWEFYNKKKN